MNIPTMTRNQFIEMLIDCHVPFEYWGRDAGNKVTRLYREYLSKRRAFILCRDDRLMIRTDYVALQVCHKGSILVESYSESYSGSHICPSNWTMIALLPSKTLLRNIMVDWMYRVIFGEGQKRRADRFQSWLDRTDTLRGRPEVSREYPGIWVVSTIHAYRWELPDQFYEKFGYAFGTTRAGSIYEWMSSPEGTLSQTLLEIGAADDAGQ